MLRRLAELRVQSPSVQQHRFRDRRRGAGAEALPFRQQRDLREPAPLCIVVESGASDELAAGQIPLAIQAARPHERIDQQAQQAGGLAAQCGPIRRVGRCRGGRARRAGPPRPPTAAPPDAPDWAALRRQPSGLLRLLIDALMGARRLDRERDLTCRELIARARFDNDAQRRGFAQIALLAERERFGPCAAPTVPESMLLDARTLHAQLGKPPEHAGEDAR